MKTPAWLRQLREEAQDASQGGGGTQTTLPPVDDKDKELEAMRQRMLQLEERVKQTPQTQAPAPATPQGTVDKKELERRFWSNPLEMTAQLVGAMVQQQQNQNADVLAEVARDRVRSSDPEVFDALEVHITAAMQSVPPQYKANTTVWQNAFNQVKGEHLSKVLELKGKKAGNQSTSDGPVPVNTKAPAAPAAPKLSDEEAYFAKKFKLTPESYTKGKEFFTDQSKLWDQVITFDSDIKRATGAK